MTLSTSTLTKSKKEMLKTFGPVGDLEKHLSSDWWKWLFNSLYLKTDGDVVENPINTASEINLLIKATSIKPSDHLLDLCCGQGRHAIELAKRGFQNITGIDRSRYLIRTAKKRSKKLGLKINFLEGDARKIAFPDQTFDCVFLMGNSFGYFEREEDDIALLKEVKRILVPKGKIVLDIVDGSWLKNNFEARSWEWIDQNHLVCRERSLTHDGKRLITREVIINAEKGVIADQFYAERLYSAETLTISLQKAGFSRASSHGNILPESNRGYDLGMMERRLFMTANSPASSKTSSRSLLTDITVIMGDPKLPDTVKKDGKFNKEDFKTISVLKQNLKKIKDFRFNFLNDHDSIISTFMECPPQFVFNLCDEGYKNEATKELHIPAILELLNIPYTGAGPACLSMCYNKSIVRAIAQDLGVPVPLESYLDPSDQMASLPSIFPALIKPNCGDNSIGITQDAVVHNAEQLISYVNYIKEILPNRAVLVQEFLSGKEYSVGLIGNNNRFKVLPILEVDYGALPDHLPKILSYESKFIPDSPYCKYIKYKKAHLDEDSYRKIVDYSIALFEKVDCRDYARFDFRTDLDGNIKLLEINPNPGWYWDGKFNIMAGFDGIKYFELLNFILQAAKERIFGSR